MAIKGDHNEKISMALILGGAFSWSNAMTRTNEQKHKHEQHEEQKDEGYEMLSKGESERTEKLNTLYFTEAHRAAE